MVLDGTRHVSILLKELTDPVIEAAIALHTPGVVIDATLGGGGHTEALLLGLRDLPGAVVVAFDRDQEAIVRAGTRLATWIASGRLRLIHAPFSSLHEHVQGASVVGAIADLGFSSDQIDEPSRGFSFKGDGPLDMRMDTSQGETALQLLSRLSEREIADLIWELGEERFSRRIARRVVEARSSRSLPQTTGELAELVSRCVPRSPGHRIHPATRTFQALRLAVNDELGELGALLDRGIMSVKPGGVVGILTFHSLEDRRVKHAFKRDGLEPLTKKPIVPSDTECEANPRARSAKLRLARRV